MNRILQLVIGCLVTLMWFIMLGHAQTNISIPAASGAGIKSTLPERFGINLDDSYNYGNNQLTANLLASDGDSFQPQTWQGSSTNSYCPTSSQWVDVNGYSPQIGNFWSGGTYQIVGGMNNGATGTITASSPATGAQGQTLTLSGTLAHPCTGGEGSPDQMITRCPTPLTTCAGGFTPSQLAGINLTTNGGGSAGGFETTDVSPNSQALQAIKLVAAGTAESGVQSFYEGLLLGHGYINLNGTYTLTFRAKATAGAPTVFAYVDRTGGQTFLATSVNPTVNATPGAGWTDYSFTFTAAEVGAQVEDGSVWLDSQGGTTLIQDIALTENPTGGNPTVFRNAVYQHLLALQPGMLRMMTMDSWGCTTTNMMLPTYSGRSLCGFNTYLQYGQPISYGWSDFLELNAAIGSDPWITFSAYTSTAEMANVAAYLGGTLGNGNPYTKMRTDYQTAHGLSTAPWTSQFNRIYLEMGNEIWNTPNGNNIWSNGGQNYGALLGANTAALKAAPVGYSSKIKMVGSGFVLQSDYAFGWNWSVLTGAGSNLPDYIDGAPYMMQDLTDFSSVFGPMFAEPVNYTLPSGPLYGLQNYTATQFPGVNGAVYETNLTTNCALSGTTQSQLNQNVAGTGAGLDATLTMLLGARDGGVLVQNFFAEPEVYNSMGIASSLFTSQCPAQNINTIAQPLWGANLLMPGPTDTSAIDRPSGIALKMVNNAMALSGNLHLLNTVQTSTPTYNQPASQPDPTASAQFTAFVQAGQTAVSAINVTSGYMAGYLQPIITGTGIQSGTTWSVYNGGANGTLSLPATQTGNFNFQAITYHIAANAAVPLVQAFAFANDTGNLGLIVYNLSLSSSEAVIFSGTNAPTGSVQRCVWSGGGNLTNNNEDQYIGATPNVPGPTCTTVISPSGDTLVAGSMATYTWSTGSTPTAVAPVLTPGTGSYSGTQSVTAASTTPGNTICTTNDGTTPVPNGGGTGCSHGTPYSGAISVSTTTTLMAVTGAPSYLPSATTTATYTLPGTAAAPTFNVSSGSYPGPTPVTLSTATPGCSAFLVLNTTNAQSGGNLTGTVATNPYTVPALSTQTLYGQVQNCPGNANSTISNSGPITTTFRTFYIRPGGGNRYDANVPAGQCDGLGDADYVSGVNQHCAFNQLQYMWDDQTSAGAEIWAMSSGDHVIIRGCAAGANQPYNASPACRIGWDNNVSPGNANWCKGGSNGGCHNPPIPPGTSTQHTQILGANYAACTKSNSQVIFGGFGVSWALDLTGGANYVDLECITDTSHTQVVSGTTGICITHGTTVGNVPAACITSVGSTLSDYDGNGIETDNTTANILMQDMWITGHTASGLQGPIGGAIIWNRVFVGFNGFAGWNFDDGSATPDAAGSTFAGSYVTMLGNGCNQEYPVVDTFPGLYCFDLNSGGFGDSFSGQQTNLQSFTCDHCTTTYNTKDGMIGPHTFLANLSYTNSSWTGNMGQQWKWNSQTNSTAQMLNNVVNANCFRMSQAITGWPSSFNHYLTLYCRANADVASYSSAPGSSVLIANNTFTTYEKQIFDLGATTTGQCGTATQIFENNLFWGVTVATNYFPGASGSAPAVYFLSDGTCTYTPSYNLEFGVRNGSCPGSTFVCTDPLLNGEPAPGGIPPESAMDVFAPISPGFQPGATSPAKGAGANYAGLLDLDFYGTSTTSPPVIGAANAAAPAPPTSGISSSGGIVFSNITAGP